jgi:hypothetical protein
VDVLRPAGLAGGFPATPTNGDVTPTHAHGRTADAPEISSRVYMYWSRPTRPATPGKYLPKKLK